MNEIKGFFKENYFLSNFYTSVIKYGDLIYLNAESAFQAQKTLNENERKKFENLNPNVAKSLGRKLTLRPDWEEIKEKIMYEIVLAKFTQNPKLKALLLSTGDAYLEETNTWCDNCWGNCTCQKCQDTPGENKLGKILMQVRNSLRSE